MNHKIELIKLKGHNDLVPIDVNIVDVVVWLNSFESVRTLFSCEGEPGKPYVQFICTDQNDLKTIIEKVQYKHGPKSEDMWLYGRVIVDAPSWMPTLRYYLRFYSMLHRMVFTTFIKTGRAYPPDLNVDSVMAVVKSRANV